MKMSPPRSNASNPLPANPNGGGSFGWLATIATAASATADATSTSKPAAQAIRVPRAATGRVNTPCTQAGANVQRGALPAAGGLPDDLVGVVGLRWHGRLREPHGQIALEAVGVVHAAALEADPIERGEPHEPASARPSVTGPSERISSMAAARDRHPGEVMEHEHGSLVGVEAPEASLQQVAVGDAARLVADDRRGDRREVDLDGATSPLAVDVEAGVDRQPIEPGPEPVRVAQAGQVPPGADVGVLDGIPGELRVAQDQARNGLRAG